MQADSRPVAPEPDASGVGNSSLAFSVGLYTLVGDYRRPLPFHQLIDDAEFRADATPGRAGTSAQALPFHPRCFRRLSQTREGIQHTRKVDNKTASGHRTIGRKPTTGPRRPNADKAPGRLDESDRVITPIERIDSLADEGSDDRRKARS